MFRLNFGVRPFGCWSGEITLNDPSILSPPNHSDVANSFGFCWSSIQIRFQLGKSSNCEIFDCHVWWHRYFKPLIRWAVSEHGCGLVLIAGTDCHWIDCISLVWDGKQEETDLSSTFFDTVTLLICPLTLILAWNQLFLIQGFPNQMAFLVQMFNICKAHPRVVRLGVWSYVLGRFSSLTG